MQTFSNNLVVNGIFLAFLDGRKCAMMARFYEEIAKALNFPDYFVPNLDALDECMSDLSWIAEQEIHLIILNYDDLLSGEPYNLEVVGNILAGAISELEEQGKYLSLHTQS